MTEEVEGTPEAGAEPLSFGAIVAGIAGTVADRRSGGAMSRGERAELRRMRTDAPFPPEPFWALVERFEIPPPAEPFWMDVVPLMVDHAHQRGRSPGRALAEAKVSGARLERWLRLEPDRARKEARRLLAKLDEGLDWVAFAGLLRFWTPRDRRALARDFFLSPAYREREKLLSEQET